MNEAPPSTFLPGLAPAPPPSLLLASLSRLDLLAAPKSTLVDLRPSVYAYATSLAQESGGATNAADAFETSFARVWLEKVLALGSRALARGADDTDEWEEAVDRAARLLADMAGPSAQGSMVKTYLLPHAAHRPASALAYPTPPPTRPGSTVPFAPRASPAVSWSDVAEQALALTIRDGTLLEASTGHRTWGSASILSHLLAANPSRFFPPRPGSPSRDPLRVLELGSGTGLVGLTAAAVLSREGPARAEVVLSDGGDEPEAVLSNLRDNVAANSARLSPDVHVRVERLDWRDYLLSAGESVASPTSSNAPPHAERFDLLLGTDLVYERDQAVLLHAAAAGLLRFPSASLNPASTFWLALPIRPTHAQENAQVAALFPPAASAPPAAAPELQRTDPATRRTYRLVSLEREELVGPSGFAATGAVRGRASAMGELRYCVVRIGWQEVAA